MNLKSILAKFSPCWNNDGLTFSRASQQSILNTVTVSSLDPTIKSTQGAFFMANSQRHAIRSACSKAPGLLISEVGTRQLMQGLRRTGYPMHGRTGSRMANDPDQRIEPRPTNRGNQVMNKLTLAIASAAFCLAQGAIAAGSDAKLAAPTPGATPGGVAGCSNSIVQDCSFESGTPSTGWTEASSNFGTPICDIGGCGLGGSTNGSNSGAFWTWFGGIASVVEEGSVSQSIVIPAAATGTLTFYFLAPVCSGDAADFVEATMDGNQVWRADATNAICGTTSPYAQISVDVSAFVDGGSHTLAFHSITQGSSTTNFFIDDVDLTTAGAPGGPPAAIDLPSLGTSAMIGLGALLAMFGFAGLRRRRMN